MVDALTTMTTKDMYRKAVIDQIELINKQKPEALGQDTLGQKAYGVLGVYWSVAALKNLLVIYLQRTDSKEEELEIKYKERYTRLWGEVEIDFSDLFPNPTMSSIIHFMKELTKWEEILSLEFSYAGLLPQQRVRKLLASDHIILINNLEELSDAIIRFIPEEQRGGTVEWVEAKMFEKEYDPTKALAHNKKHNEALNHKYWKIPLEPSGLMKDIPENEIEAEEERMEQEADDYG